MTPTWTIPAVFGALFAAYAIVRAARTLLRRSRDAAHFTAWEREPTSERSER